MTFAPAPAPPRLAPPRLAIAAPPLFRALLALAVVALLWGWLLTMAMPTPGRAQPDGGGGPVPASLIRVDLVAQSPTESQFRLTFAPRANGFGAVGAGPTAPAMGFALASRGNGAVAPAGLNGFVRAIAFDQMDSVLVVRFTTSGTGKASATASDAQTILVTVSNGVGNAPAAARRATATDAPPIVVNGTPPAAQPAPGDGAELVMLHYADVSEIVGLLTDGLTVKSNDVFTPHEPGFGQASLNNNGYTPAPPQQATPDDEPLGQSVDAGIAIDRRLNAVWLKGPPERIARMKAEIAMIDVPVDSVVLETELVELTESGARDVGIDFTNANGQIAVATLQTGGFIPVGTVPNGGGRLSSATLQAALYAQVSKGEGRIVSRPRIAAQSGTTAKIITGDALPILTSITLSGVNGVSQQVQYVNVGVTLQIAPRVSPDGWVTSHLFCVVSSVSGYSQGYPTISQREAQTSATVRDGETFVIGGLTQETSLTSNGKVPGLGDVPLVGNVFRNSKTSKARTELYIVVTPHVVHIRPDGAAPTPGVPVAEGAVAPAAAPAPALAEAAAVAATMPATPPPGP